MLWRGQSNPPSAASVPPPPSRGQGHGREQSRAAGSAAWHSDWLQVVPALLLSSCRCPIREEEGVKPLHLPALKLGSWALQRWCVLWESSPGSSFMGSLGCWRWWVWIQRPPVSFLIWKTLPGVSALRWWYGSCCAAWQREMGFSYFLLWLCSPPLPHPVLVPPVPPVQSQSAVVGLLVTSLYMFLFLYHSGPSLLGGCASRGRRNVCGAHRSRAGEGWGAWGGIPGSWCHGERRQERTWTWWPGGRGRTSRLLYPSCLQFSGASPGGGRCQPSSSWPKGSACGTKVGEMFF